jgi:hypothetical protein
MLLSLLIGGLALFAALRHIVRRIDGAEGATRLTDELIRQIEEEGALELDEDEPLDPARIEEEEELFWEEERWDEADPI